MANRFSTRIKRLKQVHPEAIGDWPAWFYGPDDQSQIFDSPLDVPEGWHDHPSKVGDPTAKTELPGYDEALKAAEEEANAEEDEEAAETGAGDGEEQPDGSESSEGNGESGSEESEQQEALLSIDDMTKEEIVNQLAAKGIAHNPSFSKGRLYDLLADNVG